MLLVYVCIKYKVAIKKSALTSGTPDGSGDVRRDETDENPKRDFGPHGSPWTSDVGISTDPSGPKFDASLQFLSLTLGLIVCT